MTVLAVLALAVVTAPPINKEAPIRALVFCALVQYLVIVLNSVLFWDIRTLLPKHLLGGYIYTVAYLMEQTILWVTMVYFVRTLNRIENYE